MDKLSPLGRLISFMLLLFSLLASGSIISNLVLIAFVFLLAALSGCDKKKAFIPVYRIRHFLLFIFLLNSLFSETGDILSFFVFRISGEGIFRALAIVYRTAFITLLASLYTSCSTINEINDSLYILLYPLKLIFIPVDMLASAFSLSLHFVESFSFLSERLRKVRALRRGGNERSILTFKSIVIPLFIITFKKADDLSLSLEARGYSAEMRVNKSYLRVKGQDIILILAQLIFLVLIFGAKV